MLRAAFAGTFAATLKQPVKQRLAVPCDLVTADEAEIVPLLADADVLVTMALTAEMGRSAARLKLVQVPGAGLDRIDRAALPSGAALANVYGHETGIAEYAIGAMLALSREFVQLDTALRRGEWHSQWAVGTAIPPTWPELAGKTIGILGYGHIGGAVARRARAFDMTVEAIRRDAQRPSDGLLDFCGGPDQLDEVLSRADFVVVAMPATEATIGSIGARQIALMKPTAFLVNIARAQIVDETALYEALARRLIAGAALDVWYRYPPRTGRDRAGDAAVPHAAECADDTARLGLDRRHASHTRRIDRREHSTGRCRRAVTQCRAVIGTSPPRRDRLGRGRSFASLGRPSTQV